MQQKETLAKSEEELNEEEVKIRADVKAADELLKEAKAKLNSALETKLLNKKDVTVAQMMLETAATKRENAMKQIRYGISRNLLIRQHTNFWMKLYTEKENQIRKGKQQQNKDVRRKLKSDKGIPVLIL